MVDESTHQLVNLLAAMMMAFAIVAYANVIKFRRIHRMFVENILLPPTTMRRVVVVVGITGALICAAAIKLILP